MPKRDSKLKNRTFAPMWIDGKWEMQNHCRREAQVCAPTFLEDRVGDNKISQKLNNLAVPTGKRVNVFLIPGHSVDYTSRRESYVFWRQHSRPFVVVARQQAGTTYYATACQPPDVFKLALACRRCRRRLVNRLSYLVRLTVRVFNLAKVPPATRQIRRVTATLMHDES